MSRTRTARRFAVPVAIAAGVVTVAAAAGIVSASGGSDLPERSAAQLLADIQNSDVPGMSGTIVQNADLGLPDLGTAGSDLTSLASGSHNMRIWYAAPDKVRTALLDKLGETDIIRNGEDVWHWSSQNSTATHYTLPDELGGMALWPPMSPAGTAVSPQEAAEQALRAIGPSTDVSTERTVEVADRDAYELVLSPKDGDSLVAEVRLAIDSETGVPLRTQVFAEGKGEPAFELAFSRIEFAEPDAENFTFTPPAGVTVEEGTDEVGDFFSKGHDSESANEPQVVGDGWASVVVADFDLDKVMADMTEASEQAQKDTGRGFDMGGILDALPEVSGEWGSGRLFSSTLVNVLVTDDGRLLAGAVTPDRLYEVAAA